MQPWNENEYWIFCDESIQSGPKFSNFFGGAIVPASRHADIENQLRALKAKIGFLHELKWQRVSEQWLEGYKGTPKNNTLLTINGLRPALACLDL